MKKFNYIFIFFFILNCTSNKASNNHGFRFIQTKYDKIIVNKTNKNDVKSLIGPPSTKSDFEDLWFYIERKKTNQSLLKLGKKKISKNDILLIKFNKVGLVSDKKLLNLKDMNDLKIVEKITEKKYNQNNLVYDIFTTLREKINAPTRNRKK